MAQQGFERRLIGKILIDRELITPDQLTLALVEQGRTPGKEYLGDILVRLGYVTEKEVVTALVLQCDLPYLAVSRYEIAPEIASLIPAKLAWEGRLVALDRIGMVLSVVMLNPLNEKMRQEVERVTGCQIATFISTRSEIEAVLKRLYPQQE